MNNNKGFIKIIVAIIIVFVVFVLGYSVLNKKSEAPVINSNNQNQTSTVPSINTPNQTTTPNKISEWQTYENNKAGFSIKYPSEWGDVKEKIGKSPVADVGEFIDIEFKNFYITGLTSDYQPYEEIDPVYRGGDPFEFCKKTFAASYRYRTTLSGCEKINNNITMITYSTYIGLGMDGNGRSIGFSRDAYIRNGNNKYSGLKFNYLLSVYSNDQLPKMDENQISEIAKKEISKLDKNKINLFNKVVSSIQFTN